MNFLQGAGLGMSALGGLYEIYQAGDQAKLAHDEARAAAEQAGIALANSRAAAELESLNASRAESDAAFKSAVLNAQALSARAAGRRAVGTQRTAALASGIEFSGSVTDALAETVFQNERAVRLGIAFGQREVAALRLEAQDRRVHAEQLVRTGQQAAKAAIRTGRARAKFAIAKAQSMAVEGLFKVGEAVATAIAFA